MLLMAIQGQIATPTYRPVATASERWNEAQ
jgi:hypothetical protein